MVEPSGRASKASLNQDLMHLPPSHPMPDDDFVHDEKRLDTTY